MQKVYLGDGVYIRHDGSGFILTTEDGVITGNTIYLEPLVVVNLLKYLKEMSNAAPE